MGRISMVFVFCVFAAICFEQTTCLPTTNGNENINIPDKVQLYSFSYGARPKEIHDVVARSLSEQNKNRRLLNVSNTRNKPNLARKGLPNVVTQRIAKRVSPSYHIDAKTGRKLKEHLGDSHARTRRSGFVVPAKKKGRRTQLSSVKNNRRRNVNKDLKGPFPNKKKEMKQKKKKDKKKNKKKTKKVPN